MAPFSKVPTKIPSFKKPVQGFQKEQGVKSIGHLQQRASKCMYWLSSTEIRAHPAKPGQEMSPSCLFTTPFLYQRSFQQVILMIHDDQFIYIYMYTQSF